MVGVRSRGGGWGVRFKRCAHPARTDRHIELRPEAIGRCIAVGFVVFVQLVPEGRTLRVERDHHAHPARAAHSRIRKQQAHEGVTEADDPAYFEAVQRPSKRRHCVVTSKHERGPIDHDQQRRRARCQRRWWQQLVQGSDAQHLSRRSCECPMAGPASSHPKAGWGHQRARVAHHRAKHHHVEGAHRSAGNLMSE